MRSPPADHTHVQQRTHSCSFWISDQWGTGAHTAYTPGGVIRHQGETRTHHSAHSCGSNWAPLRLINLRRRGVQVHRQSVGTRWCRDDSVRCLTSLPGVKTRRSEKHTTASLLQEVARGHPLADQETSWPASGNNNYLIGSRTESESLFGIQSLQSPLLHHTHPHTHILLPPFCWRISFKHPSPAPANRTDSDHCRLTPEWAGVCVIHICSKFQLRRSKKEKTKRTINPDSCTSQILNLSLKPIYTHLQTRWLL